MVRVGFRKVIDWSTSRSTGGISGIHIMIEMTDANHPSFHTPPSLSTAIYHAGYARHIASFGLLNIPYSRSDT
jgi:hypothetical protein